jgi:hypothetical protein
MSQYINCENGILPVKAGFYSIYIERVRTALPQYVEFNGNSWVGLESIKEIFDSNAIYWSEGEEPLNKHPELPKLF